MAFKDDIAKIAKQSAGFTFWLKKTVTSSDITESPVAITSVAIGGELAIEDIIIKSDATGLAGGTTFRIVSDNAKGTTTVFLTKVSKLGVYKSVNMTSEFADPNNESAVITGGVTGRQVNIPTVLESGKKLSVANTGAVGTGAGTIDIYIQFRKLSDSSRITPA